MNFIVLALVTVGQFVPNNAAPGDFCQIFYKDHCLVTSLTERFDHEGGQNACEEIGGTLANIVDVEEFNLIRDLWRFIGTQNRLDLRTGMKFKDGNLYNGDGTEADMALPWATHWPRENYGWNDVIITVVMGWNEKNFASPEGLSNKPGTNQYYSLCEIP